jgi:hypothetical protein
MDALHCRSHLDGHQLNSVDDTHDSDDHQYQYRTNIALIDHNTPESARAFALTQGTSMTAICPLLWTPAPRATCPQRNLTFKTYKQSHPNRSKAHDRSIIHPVHTSTISRILRPEYPPESPDHDHIHPRILPSFPVPSIRLDRAFSSRNDQPLLNKGFYYLLAPIPTHLRCPDYE